MIRTLLFTILYFCSHIVSAQLADISFSNNNWSTSTDVSISNDVLTIKGSPNAYRNTSLAVTIPASKYDIYFVAEVYFENITIGSQPYYSPKFKMYEGENKSVVLETFNITKQIEGKWIKTGMKIKNNKSLSSITLEFGLQKATGTMKIRNPQLLNTQPSGKYEFPFDIPSDSSCSINIITEQSHPFQNDLLSSNSHFSWSSYDWSDQEIIDLIAETFPMSNMRFPGGTVGNYYNWATDTYHPDELSFASTSRKNAYNNGFVFNYNGYKNNCVTNSASSTLMFNVIQDDIEAAKSRLQSRLDDGLDIKWIEMGNENYFSNQAFGNVSTLSKYISHTQTMTAGLKQIAPDIKVAVNISHDDYAQGGWNDLLSKESYYDACVMHPYVQTNTFMLNALSAYTMFSAYKTTAHRINEFTEHFGHNKSLILTEWSILSDGTPENFVQTLSIADMFCAIEKGNADGVIQQAGIHMLYHSDKYYESTLSYHNGSEMVLTANGVLYATLFDIFKDKNVYDAISTSAELETGLPAVNAKAVKDDDWIRVFVVNKLPVASPLNVAINGKNYSGEYYIKSFHEDPSQVLDTPYPTDFQWTESQGSGQPQVPAYSIAVVSINTKDLDKSDVTSSDENLKLGRLEVYATSSEIVLSIGNQVGKPVSLQVYTLDGKEVLTFTDDKNLSSVLHIPAKLNTQRLYLVRVKVGNQQIYKKIVLSN